MTDEQLIRAYLEGSPHAIRIITGWIESVVRSRLWDGRVAPEDVVADTRLKLLINFRQNSFRLESSLKTLIQRITLYTLIDAARRAKNLSRIPAGADVADPADLHSQLEEREQQEIFARAIAVLPQGCRELFEVVFRERTHYRQMAKRLGISEGALKTRLSRCRDRLIEVVRELT